MIHISAYIGTIKDGTGNVMYPNTKMAAVYDADGNPLEVVLDNLTKTTVATTAPESNHSGDIWYEVI